MGLALAIALITILPGCGLLRAPGKAVQAITPGKTKMDPDEVAMLVQRMADEYNLRTVQALDEYARISGTPQAASEALRWKVIVLSYSMRIAGGYNPYGNLIDLVALISLNHDALEHHWALGPNGAAFEPWLEASRELETNSWQAAAAVFAPKQLDQLRQALETYRRENVASEYPLFTRPLEFASNLKSAAAESTESQTSILGIVGLDPTIGLDPAVQEVTRSRLFAERAMFTLQRMPNLIRLQTEILADDMLRQPELQVTLTNTSRLAESVDRMSRAVEIVSRTAADLPDRVATERAAILKELDRQQGQLRDLSAEVGRSLAEADKMSGSLTVTITNLNALMKRFGVGEPRTGPVRTNTEPFRILDYAATADRVGEMAKNLNALVASVDRAGPQVRTLSEQAGADARRLMDHAFHLALTLIAALLGGAVTAGLLYRFLARKLFDREKTAAPAAKWPPAAAMLMALALLFFGSGCSGIDVQKSVSPIDFFIPGLLRNTPPAIPGPASPTAGTADIHPPCTST